MSKSYLKDTKTFLLVFSYQLTENEKNINTNKYHDSVGASTICLRWNSVNLFYKHPLWG